MIISTVETKKFPVFFQIDTSSVGSSVIFDFAGFISATLCVGSMIFICFISLYDGAAACSILSLIAFFFYMSDILAGRRLAFLIFGLVAPFFF